MEGCRSSRRLHVIYFLSRNGCIEHPHLLRVHHHTTNAGVRLRDIKRWLGELRGNRMPDSFSWSYKRKYKTGYVWQDLVDDDLINPISDNEYVLKGSDITTTINSNYTTSSSGESDDVNVTTTPPHQKQKQKQKQQLHYSHSSISTSEIQEESPFLNSETSTLTDDDSPVKLDKTTHSNSTTAALHTNVTTTASAAKASSIKSHKKGWSSSSSKNVLRKLITCGGMDTNDSAQVFRKNDDTRPLLINNISSSTDDVGGSQRVFGNPASTQPPPYCINNARKSFDDGGVKDYSSSSTKSKRDEQRDNKAPTAAYFSVNGPTCSQCGKTFRPEKLHSHMKSCKGMKALSRAAAAASVSDQAPKGGHGESGRNCQIGA